MTDPVPGRYRHYKGNEYTVLGVARHSETEEELVVYRQEYGDRGVWVRPKPMFLETVSLDGQEMPRFRLLKPATVAERLQGNLLTGLPSDLPQEVFETLASHSHVRVERIVSRGQSSPPDFWYDQAQAEFVVLLQGAATLQFETETVDLLPGAFLNIPAHCRHRVAWTDPGQTTVWLTIHYDDELSGLS